MSTPRLLPRIGMRSVALTYLAALLVIPVLMIFVRTFEDGIGDAIEAVTSPDGIHAFLMTLLCVGVAVPLNTAFGILCALVLVRQRFPGRNLINSVIDLPFAVSPVVIGLSLFLVYGETGFIGGPLVDAGIEIIFSWPGLILATIFVSLPFVVREVMPVLQEVGDEQEQAAQTLGASGWQTFWKVTLPSIRWGVTYGVVLATARALGEFGAVAVVSGKITGETETLPLFVENQYGQFNLAGAYGAAIVLAILALSVLLVMNLFRRGGDQGGRTPTMAVLPPEAKEAAGMPDATPEPEGEPDGDHR
jgi:sulfate/thiosulfate transport system permease protein